MSQKSWVVYVQLILYKKKTKKYYKSNKDNQYSFLPNLITIIPCLVMENIFQIIWINICVLNCRSVSVDIVIIVKVYRIRTWNTDLKKLYFIITSQINVRYFTTQASNNSLNYTSSQEEWIFFPFFNFLISHFGNSDLYWT